MPIDSDSRTDSSCITDVDQPHEYYEELDNKTIGFQNPKASSKSLPKKQSTQPPPPRPIDPIQQLNEQLNRQFRPDLVCYKSS